MSDPVLAGELLPGVAEAVASSVLAPEADEALRTRLDTASVAGSAIPGGMVVELPR